MLFFFFRDAPLHFSVLYKHHHHHHHHHTRLSSYCFLLDRELIQYCLLLEPTIRHGANKHTIYCFSLCNIHVWTLCHMLCDTDVLLSSVVSVRQCFAVLEDGVLAHSLQEQESEYSVQFMLRELLSGLLWVFIFSHKFSPLSVGFIVSRITQKVGTW